MKHKIIFAAQDPGGFNAIYPIVEELKKNKEFAFKVFLSGKSQEIAKKKRVNYHSADNLSKRELRRILKKESPDLVFTGVSAGLCLEKKLISIAKAQKIKTAVILDFWSDYKGCCFTDSHTENFYYLPDYVLAIDEFMKKEMIKEGIPVKKIFIIGNPFFDTFSKLSKNKENKNLISFFCQPFSELYKKRDKKHFGFDEIEVFKDIVKALEKIDSRKKLIIKLHPKCQKLDKFDKIIEKSNLKISVEKKLSAEDLIEKSEIVIGMNSMVLFESALIAKKVLSYQPNLKKRDRLMSNRLGLSAAVYKKKGLYPCLKKILLRRLPEKNSDVRKRYTQNNSTKKAIDFITNILKNG